MYSLTLNILALVMVVFSAAAMMFSQPLIGLWALGVAALLKAEVISHNGPPEPPAPPRAG
jgi:membrane glycosyltransferase